MLPKICSKFLRLLITLNVCSSPAMHKVFKLILIATIRLLCFKGATKLDLTHYSCVIIVSATRRRRDIKIPLSVGTRSEKFNIVSNDHGRTHKCDFSVFDQKYLFWANLFKTKKKLRLSV